MLKPGLNKGLRDRAETQLLIFRTLKASVSLHLAVNKMEEDAV